MTKIDIFSGFLGAGKTTLIKKLLSEAYAGEKVVLIENEFGEIGIDGGFLKDAGVEITEMNSIFVHSVYLYDDHFTIIINASKKPLSIDNIPLDEIEEAFEGENEGKEGCSSMTTPAPPEKSTHLSTKTMCAFFNEIRLRRVKYGFAM